MHDALRQLDLNLLLVFDALYRHRSVVAAATELSISPSACSHALARLRGALADELFIREGAGMQPTARAHKLAEGVQDGLRLLANSLGEGRAFQPSTSKQTFVFGATDFTAFAVMPRLIAAIEAAAPRIRTKVEPVRRRDALDALVSGRVHFALGIADAHATSHPELESLRFYEEDYVVLARQGHPRVRDKLALEQYLQERHVAVLPWETEASVIDAALLRAKHARDVALELPHMLAVPVIIASTDYLATLPRSLAMQAADSLPLQVLPAPFRTPLYSLHVFFHQRHASSASQQWMLAQLQKALASP
ncbi:LysR family transcriptional regulator [Comamonas sp. JUb58]|uniref:LysR family transcriptional regulator n=1 Tax=Comamonas sp. JUb58 TaxID=2485114 RepID=UPI00105DD216|nr:LysR family transcriptional regulator [Comamonas sp. JUb58]TDS83690.1 LysR family transcriptional regulator [Comamonas sp. JUb58]